MKHLILRLSLLLGTLLVASFGSILSADNDRANLLFEKDIRPILKEHCFHCHGEEAEVEAGLDVRLVRFLIKGGESGPAIVPGDPEKSKLLEVLKSGDMPKGKDRLPDETIALIEKWLQNGALTARPEPETLSDELLFTREERQWWSLQPIESPTVPEGQSHPVDAFIAAELRTVGLDFSAEADPRTLIRRLTYDLTGLPPTPDETAAFVEQAKYDPDSAYRSLVNRLLESPAYGERWARHWLDIAGYADSDGYNEKDIERKHAWRYRDYVIRALNNDKPYDQFIREQIAGDEIAASLGLTANSPTVRKKNRYAELLTATGFLRMAPDGSASKNDVATRNDCVSDTMEIISTTLYGMTVGCAECHNHRYDPISQADYFRLRAIFDPGFDMNRWRVPRSRLVSLETREEAAEAARIEEKAKKIDAERKARERQFIAEVLEKELEKRDQAIRSDIRTAYNIEAAKRTPEQKALLAEHPSIKNLSPSRLYLYDTTYKTRNAAVLKEIAAKATEIRNTKPEVEYIHAFTEIPKKPEAVAATRVFFRGNPESPKQKVKPADLSVLSSWRNVSVPEFSDAVPTTGRRLAFANSITDGEHPLLARVIVNRVWMHHFGRGIVATVGDFGILGDEPSHPLLLDWLASHFMKSGWSLKKLHRLILTSRTWKQISTRTPAAEALDPDNRYLSRQNSRRLEAEILRDALLATSGKLNRRPFGPPVPVMPTEEGSIVIGNDTTDSAGRQTGKFIPLNGEEFRRSIYVQVRRSRPLDILATFDAPAMNDPNCELRPVTTVSPQSLLLMNNSGMRQYARDFALRLDATGGPGLESKIRTAFELCYAREATSREVEDSRAFIEAQENFYRENPARFEKESGPAEKENDSPALLALGAFCHALMSANEFLYID